MGQQQFRVLVPEGNGYSDPKTVVRIIDHLQQLRLEAGFKCESGIPVKNEEDGYTLLTGDDRAANLAPAILTRHYGLTVLPA